MVVCDVVLDQCRYSDCNPCDELCISNARKRLKECGRCLILLVILGLSNIVSDIFLRWVGIGLGSAKDDAFWEDEVA